MPLVLQLKSSAQATGHLYTLTTMLNRIMLNMTSLASHAHGLNKSVPIINVTTLQEAKFVIKTQLGTFEQHYTHSELYLLYGIVEGARKSPTVWTMNSSTLFSLYNDDAQGTLYHSPC